MWRSLVALVACASCDTIWGLGNVSPAPADAPDPGDLGAVTGHYIQRWFGLDQAGTLPHADEFTMSDLQSALVTLDNGTTRAVAITDQGFSFTIPNVGDHYSLHIETPVGSRTWNSSSPTLELVERYTRPPNRTTVMAGTILELDMDPATVHNGLGKKEELDTIGTWSRTQVNTAVGPNIRVDCTTRDQFGVQIGAIAPPSAAFYTSTEPISNYNHLTYAARVNDVATLDGIASRYPTAPMQLLAMPVQIDSCTRVLVHGNEEAQRNHDIVPNALPGTSAWSIDIDPALDYGFLPTALPVAGGPANTMIDAQYGNPFGFGKADVTMVSFAVNTDGAASQSIVAVPAGSDHCTATVEIHEGLIALPMNVRIGDVALVTRQQLVTLSGSHVDIAWDTATVGTADAYIVFVDQLINGTPTTIEDITTTDKVVTIPTADLTSGGQFQIRVLAAIGFPNVATGDLLTTTPPVGIATFKTPPFMIQ